ncbi:MAG: sensor histidine kinase [Arenibacterium sp.]
MTTPPAERPPQEPAEGLARLDASTQDSWFNRALLALDAGEMGVFEWNTLTDACSADRKNRELWGFDPSTELTGEMIFTQVHPEDIRGLRAEVGRSLETGEDYKAEFRIIHTDGSVRWIGGRGRVTGRREDGAPSLLTGLNWDITEAKEQALRLERLAKEINHRVNNSFAVMDALITLGADSATDVGTFAETSKNQIYALAHAHRLLADQSLLDQHRSPDIALADLVDRSLAAWRQGARAENITLDVDPDIKLPTRQVSGMAMLLYELATNASKYGALGDADGALSLTILPESDGMARLEWLETLKRPRHSRKTPGEGSSGFGSILIQHCLSMLTATLHEQSITKAGFKFVLSIPCRNGSNS